MSTQLCPHCGANRQGMSNNQPCWRCRRLPTTRPQAQDPSMGSRPPMAMPLQQPLIIVKPAERPYIPRWLGCLGTLGILLGLVFFVGGLLLFITADSSEETPENNRSELANTTQTPGGITGAIPSPTATVATLPAPGAASINLPTVAVATSAGSTPTAPVAIGPFAETSIALRPTLSPTSAASLLPTPSLAPSITPVPPTPFICAGAPTTRLSVNRQAAVVNVNNVRLRDNPGLNSNGVMNVPRGEAVLVLEGPVCADSFVWWRVQLGIGTSGWMAEGSLEEYFLEPR